MLIDIFMFSIWLPKWPQKVTWLVLLLLVKMKVLYISNILWKFHSNRLNGSGDIIYPQYSGFLETCLALSYWHFEVLAAKVLIMHTQSSSGARYLNFDMCIVNAPLCVRASNINICGETAYLVRLVWALASHTNITSLLAFNMYFQWIK